MPIEIIVRPPEKVFRDLSWHGMGGSVSFNVDELTAEARDFLFAQGKYEILGECGVKKRAEALLGPNYVVGRVTNEAIESGHFPRFGNATY